MSSTSWSSTSAPSTSSNQGPNPPPGGPPLPGGAGDGANAATTTALQRNLALYGYILLFVVGYFGHISSTIIFLRRTLRGVSTSCLFVCVTVSNTIYLLVCTYDFLYVGVGLTPVSSQANPNASHALCRFRSFIQSVTMCTSAWLLLTISIDRWLRVRFPFQVKKLCTRKRVLFGALFILLCAIALNSHLLLPSLGSLSGSMTGASLAKVWSILLTCLQTVLPTVALLIVTIDMFRRLLIQQKQRQRLNQSRRNAFIDRQVLIIMLTSILLFFSTQIPLSLFNILLSPVLRFRLTMTQALELTSIFNYVASINYATTFYVHCLTSGLFRQEFYDLFRCRIGRSGGRRVGVVTQMIGATQLELTRTGTKRHQNECTLETIER